MTDTNEDRAAQSGEDTRSLKDRVFGSDAEGGAGAPVGRDDVDADRARTGAPVDEGYREQRDSDQAAVGAEDVEADVRRSGAAPDDA